MRESIQDAAKEVAETLANACNITIPEYSLIDKAGDVFLAIHVGHINDIYAYHLSRIKEDSSFRPFFGDRIILKELKPESWLRSLETQLLQRLLTESLTVGKATLESDYHRKYIPFLWGEERQIFSEANHIVFGRRGAGKSSLVLFACNQAKRNNLPFAWIALQQYRGREDLLVVPQVLYELIENVSQDANGLTPAEVTQLREEVLKLEDKGLDITKADINISLPKFARHFLPFVKRRSQFFLCIDDLHLLHPSLQPYFLSCLYSFARGNRIYLKITAIENLTAIFDDTSKEGLQTPGDAQVIRLDYNLVNPKAAKDHIKEVLDGYIRYVGIPSMASLCGKGVLERLVWASAGVPRDALYIFSNALTKALAAGRKEVAVTDINMSAAESLTEKERHVTEDVADDAKLVLEAIAAIKEFCLKDIKQNAFLVRIDPNDKRYQVINKISDLRFVHVLHPGITPEQAGEKYEALMLDYAFYTGFRKAPSVKEFKSSPEQPLVKELRKLKRFNYVERLTD